MVLIDRARPVRLDRQEPIEGIVHLARTVSGDAGDGIVVCGDPKNDRTEQQLGREQWGRRGGEAGLLVRCGAMTGWGVDHVSRCAPACFEAVPA